MTTFFVHVKFRGNVHLRVERAFRMLCSFDEPFKEALFDSDVFMSGYVMGSTGQGVAYRVRQELTEAGADRLSLVVKEEFPDVEDAEGREVREGQGKAAEEAEYTPQAA